MANITNLKPWEGAALRVVNSEQLPKWRKAVMYVRSGMSAENILRTLSVQNGNLNAQGWKIIEYREDAGYVDSSVLVSIPEEQLQALQRVGMRPLVGCEERTALFAITPRHQRSGWMLNKHLKRNQRSSLKRPS